MQGAKASDATGVRGVCDSLHATLAFSEGRLDESAAGIERMRESGQLEAARPHALPS